MPRNPFAPYARVLRTPGAVPFVTAAFFGRFPRATFTLSSILLVSAVSGSFAVAGAVSAVLVLAMAVGGPLWSRAMDQSGQRRTLALSIAAFTVSGLAFVLVVTTGAPAFTWYLLAGITGLSAPDLGAATRARWSYLLTDPADRTTAFSLESVADESVFVVGPPFMTILASAIDPAVGVIAALALGVAGGLALLLQTRTQPPVVPHAERKAVSRRPPWIVLPIVLVCVGIGTIFGSFDVTAVGFATDNGDSALAGFVIAAIGLGTALAAALFGMRRWRAPLRVRLMVASVALAVVTPVLLLATTPTMVLVSGFVVGLAISPVLISAMTLAQAKAEPDRVTETLAYPSVGLSIGVTIGATFAGSLLDAYGPAAAYLLTIGGAAAAGLVAIGANLGYRALESRADDGAVGLGSTQTALPLDA